MSLCPDRPGGDSLEAAGPTRLLLRYRIVYGSGETVPDKTQWGGEPIGSDVRVKCEGDE